MKPPALVMMTRTGRFEVNKQICTSFSNYHPETWNPLWNVESIVVGLISFMLDEEFSAGCVRESSAQRRVYARKSFQENLKQAVFQKAFSQEWIDRVLQVCPQEEIQEPEP